VRRAHSGAVKGGRQNGQSAAPQYSLGERIRRRFRPAAGARLLLSGSVTTPIHLWRIRPECLMPLALARLDPADMHRSNESSISLVDCLGFGGGAVAKPGQGGPPFRVRYLRLMGGSINFRGDNESVTPDRPRCSSIIYFPGSSIPERLGRIASAQKSTPPEISSYLSEFRADRPSQGLLATAKCRRGVTPCQTHSLARKH
jgi:hypothetical protein